MQQGVVVNTVGVLPGGVRLKPDMVWYALASRGECQLQQRLPSEGEGVSESD